MILHHEPQGAADDDHLQCSVLVNAIYFEFDNNFSAISSNNIPSSICPLILFLKTPLIQDVITPICFSFVVYSQGFLKEESLFQPQKLHQALKRAMPEVGVLCVGLTPAELNEYWEGQFAQYFCKLLPKIWP